MEFVNSVGTVIHRQLLSSGYATGTNIQPLSYEALAGPSPTGWYWSYDDGGYTNLGTSYSSPPSSPLNFYVSFPSAGTYYVRYSTRIGVSPAVEDTAQSDGSRTYSYNTFSRAGVAFSTLDTNIDLIFPVNFVELTAGGFQAVTDTTQYVKINRVEANTDVNPELIQIKGGELNINHEDTSQTTLTNFAGSYLNGRVYAGGDWSGDFTKPKTVDINGGLVLNQTFLYGGAVASPVSLENSLAAGYSVFFLDSTSASDRHYVLPFYYDGSNYTPNYDKFRAGHMCIVFNRDDNNNLVYVKGLLSGGPNYSQLFGGQVWILMYSGNNQVEGPSGVSGWIHLSSLDNNW
jgi:hypothetical protein